MTVRFALLVALTAAVALAQEPPVPTALLHSLIDIEALDTLDFEALDLAALAVEDAARQEAGLPLRFAVARPLALTPAARGTWEDLADGRLLWRLRVRAADATSLNFGFGRFRMPPGGQLLVHATDLSELVRPFTAADNTAGGQLWTPLIAGGDAILEVTIPRDRLGELELELVQVGQGYTRFGLPEAPESGACNMDVECLLASDPWRATVRASGAITRNGIDTCSGSLLNNTAEDRRVLFMTANHCGINSGNAATVVVYWNFENSSCRIPGSAASGGAGDGQRTQFASGWTFRAARSASDFTLIEFLGTVDPLWNLHWAGWDRTAGDGDCAGVPCFLCSEGSLCAGIHHPGVDEKRITFSQDPMVPSVYGGGTVPPPGNDGSHLWVKWDPDPVFPPNPTIQPPIPPQVTEPGSSGSPVYNRERRFVGQLHGGTSACGEVGNRLSDYYGFLHRSWDGGTTPDTRAADWLDPLASGATTVDGRDACTAPAVPQNLSATPNGDNRIDLAWDAVAGAERYRIYRALGACPGSGATPLVETAATSFSDTAVSGGVTYAYRVSAIDEDDDDCESARSLCDDASTTGVCLLAPAFAGLASAQSVGASACGVDLAWSAGSSSCGGGVVYNVYRSTDPAFVPGPANLLASCLAVTHYQDPTPVHGTAYHYVVRAEDETGFGGGPCDAGNEEANVVRRSAAPGGPDADLFHDDVEGPAAAWVVGGTGAGSNFAVSAAASHSPSHAWFTNDPSSTSDRWLALAAGVALPGAPTAARLEFWHRYNTESNWDGGVLESSPDGAVWSDVLAGNAARFLTGGYTGALNGTGTNPLAGRPAWHGDIASFVRVLVDLEDFAGQTLRWRWRFGADGSIGDTGWYVDDVRIFHPTACGPGLLFADGFESGDVSRWDEEVAAP